MASAEKEAKMAQAFIYWKYPICKFHFTFWPVMAIHACSKGLSIQNWIKWFFKQMHKWVSRKDMLKTIYTQNTSHFKEEALQYSQVFFLGTVQKASWPGALSRTVSALIVQCCIIPAGHTVSMLCSWTWPKSGQEAFCSVWGFLVKCILY